MPCKIMKVGGSVTAIVCSRSARPKACFKCGRPSSKLCDYRLTGKMEGKTCDMALCTMCAVHREPDTDYCPAHAAMVPA